MTKKIIIGVIAAVLVVTIAVLAAEKAREKAMEKVMASEQFGWHGRLLDRLAEAYKANDREEMGKIINKMYERREKMREFARFNGWRQWAHRRMMGQMGPGWGQGPQMPGQGFNQGCTMNGPCGNYGWAMRGQGPNQGCTMAGPRWGQFQAMRRGFGGCNNMMGNCGAFAGPQNEVTKGWGCGPGFFNGMGNCGPMAGGFGQMPCQQGGMGMGNWMPQQGGQGQMPGCGRGFQKQWTPGPGAENMGQQEWNMPRRERQNNVPPPEWGW